MTKTTIRIIVVAVLALIVGVVLFGGDDDEPLSQEIIEPSSEISDGGDSCLSDDTVALAMDVDSTDIPVDDDVSTSNQNDIPHDLMELPAIVESKNNVLVRHKGYILSYNLTTNCPNWVAWKLTRNHISGEWGRSNDFRPDNSIPYKNRVSEDAFSGSGYDRGHMCPAGDNKWDPTTMSESFFMTNMCPQDPTLNQEWWEHLEEACRRWADNEGEIYICCGPVFKGNEGSIDSYPPVRIPYGFFKVVLSLRHGNEKAIGFFYLNNDSRQTMGDAAKTVDKIEEVTGYDFFPNVDDILENKIESICKLGKWQ